LLGLKLYAVGTDSPPLPSGATISPLSFSSLPFPWQVLIDRRYPRPFFSFPIAGVFFSFLRRSAMAPSNQFSLPPPFLLLGPFFLPLLGDVLARTSYLGLYGLFDLFLRAGSVHGKKRFPESQPPFFSAGRITAMTFFFGHFPPPRLSEPYGTFCQAPSFFPARVMASRLIPWSFFFPPPPSPEG